MSDASPETLARDSAQMRTVTRALTVLGGVALFGLVGLTVAGVVYRYGLNAPIFGLEDLAKMTLAVIVSCGVALAALMRAHIAVDMLVNLFPSAVRRVLETAISGIGAAVCAYVAYALFTKGSCGRPCGEFTANLAISHVPFYYAIAAAFVIFAVYLLADVARAARSRS